MKRIPITMITLLALSAGSVSANDNMHQSKPLNFMTEQVSEQLLNHTKALSEPKLVKAQATLLRLHYEALIETGFSKDEALRIVIAKSSKDKE